MPVKLSDKLISWAPDLDENARAQAERTARLPFVAGHVALMPDAHFGLGATVGSVIPTDGAIVPAAVGVDIGCGMIAVETTFDARQLPDDLDALMPLVEARVPSGVGKAHGTTTESGAAWMAAHDVPEGFEKHGRVAGDQLGTLGSGNHFVEVCIDERDRVWVVLHSGSRGIGNKIAKVYIESAKKKMKQWFVPLEDPDLAYLVQSDPLFASYIRAMTWAQDYALANREFMMDATLRSLAETMGVDAIVEAQRINCHHNFTQREHHHNRELWITRKGAIKAGRGDLGVIPGSMGTRSYIVAGTGSPASFSSCSHGAGRRFSRSEARRQFTAEDLAARMGNRTWNADQAEQLIDEIPDAYKSIDEVMAAQSDLVTVLHELRQVFNYKGT